MELASLIGQLNLSFHKLPDPFKEIYFQGLVAMGFMNTPAQKWQPQRSHEEVINGMTPEQRNALSLFLKAILSSGSPMLLPTTETKP